MKYKKELKELDEMIAGGKILEAFESFFSDAATTRSAKGEVTVSKSQKRDLLKRFFDEMQSTEEILLHDHFLHGNQSYSKFTFVFTHKNGEKLRWHEIITRVWKDGKVVDESYSNGSLEDLKEKIKKEEKKQKETGKKPGGKAEKKEKKTEKKSTPEAVQTGHEKKKIKSKPKVIKEDNLKLLEGVGPKVEEILKGKGILSFEQLAKTDSASLKKILSEAGRHFRMLDPGSWPAQARLAADGNLSELEIVKQQLKGGK